MCGGAARPLGSGRRACVPDDQPAPAHRARICPASPRCPPPTCTASSAEPRRRAHRGINGPVRLRFLNPGALCPRPFAAAPPRTVASGRPQPPGLPLYAARGCPPISWFLVRGSAARGPQVGRMIPPSSKPGEPRSQECKLLRGGDVTSPALSSAGPGVCLLFPLPGELQVPGKSLPLWEGHVQLLCFKGLG